MTVHFHFPDLRKLQIADSMWRHQDLAKIWTRKDLTIQSFLQLCRLNEQGNTFLHYRQFLSFQNWIFEIFITVLNPTNKKVKIIWNSDQIRRLEKTLPNFSNCVLIKNSWIFLVWPPSYTQKYIHNLCINVTSFSNISYCINCE